MSGRSFPQARQIELEPIRQRVRELEPAGEILAGVLRACDKLAAAGHSEAIERGPGRHGVSNAFFVYLRDAPSAMLNPRFGAPP